MESGLRDGVYSKNEVTRGITFLAISGTALGFGSIPARWR